MKTKTVYYWFVLLFLTLLIFSGCTPPPGTRFSGIQKVRDRTYSRSGRSDHFVSQQENSRGFVRETNSIVKRAKSCIGVPYRYGGTDRRGFDCSGLVLYSYQPAGVSLPRSARSQFKSGKRITLSQAKPGDLLFFRSNRNSISHVGIFIGNGSFVHAPSKGKNVRIDKLSNPYWKKVYAGSATYLR